MEEKTGYYYNLKWKAELIFLSQQSSIAVRQVGPSVLSCEHRWARNLKNVAPQKQNAIWKTRAQYAKRNCSFELLKVHFAATINAKNGSFLQKKFKAKRTQSQLYLIRKFLVWWILKFAEYNSRSEDYPVGCSDFRFFLQIFKSSGLDSCVLTPLGNKKNLRTDLRSSAQHAQLCLLVCSNISHFQIYPLYMPFCLSLHLMSKKVHIFH